MCGNAFKVFAIMLLLITLLISYAQEARPAKKQSSSVIEVTDEDFQTPITNPRVPGSTWKEPITGMEFIWVAGGCFEMGQSEEEKGQLIGEVGEERYGKVHSDELPQHKVCVGDLWLGKTEVTVAAFRQFVEALGYQTDAERDGFAWIYTGREWEKKSGANWRDAGFQQNDDHPVVNVSWNDARAMAEWLSRQSAYKFRLPTEAEWEYGCRASTKTARYWGDSPAEACRYANVSDRAAKRTYPGLIIHGCDDRYTHTSPVGRFRGNSLGLLDMLGNVWEWCEDIYTRDAYTKHQEKNPTVTGGGSFRVSRGGGWYSLPSLVRCTARNSSPPHFRYDFLGFRLARTN